MASFYITRRIRSFLIFGIIIVSLIVAFNRSKIMDSFLKHSKTIAAKSPEKAIKIFTNYNYDTKIDLRFVTQNIQEIKNKLDEIIKNNKLNVLYKINKGNNITKLIELPNDKYKELLSSLTASPSLVSEELIRSPEYISIDDLKRRKSNIENYIQELEEKRKNSRTTYDREEAQKSIDKQTSIRDSLKALLSFKEQKGDLLLAKVDISRILSRSVGIVQSLKTFGLTFVQSFVFITIALLLCYLIILGLTRVFAILGIKTRSGSSASRYGRYSKYSGYGGYGGYGSSSKYGYGYGYGDEGYGGKRIKRKYIRKPIHKDKDKVSKSEKKENEVKTDKDE